MQVDETDQPVSNNSNVFEINKGNQIPIVCSQRQQNLRTKDKMVRFVNILYNFNVCCFLKIFFHIESNNQNTSHYLHLKMYFGHLRAGIMNMYVAKYKSIDKSFEYAWVKRNLF